MGQRSKLGGQPDWIQADETPLCSECRAEMHFIAQIDSVEADQDIDGPHFHFGDAGMLYIFYCGPCWKGEVIVQCH